MIFISAGIYLFWLTGCKAGPQQQGADPSCLGMTSAIGLFTILNIIKPALTKDLPHIIFQTAI
jgi:hypothetical protein